jgi:hypothetical protein
MKYENANDILPEELLKEIQKYAGGKLLYIPAGVEKGPGAKRPATENIYRSAIE